MTKAIAAEIISSRGWLSRCPPQFRATVLSHCEMVRFAKGKLIYQAGDTAHGLYGLVQGSLRIEAPVTPAEMHVVYQPQPGFWIGAAALIRRRPRLFSVSASTDALLLFLPVGAFELLARNPSHLRHFSELVGENGKLALTGMTDLMNPDILARVASRLVALRDEQGSKIQVTQADLASICNLSRKTINSELAKLVGLGAISRGYRSIIITSGSTLSRIAKRTTLRTRRDPLPEMLQDVRRRK
jgi:CRP/FNR family transcriptional regulator, cyclic AMP receptor protein